jgi:hypothetical protein
VEPAGRDGLSGPNALIRWAPTTLHHVLRTHRPLSVARPLVTFGAALAIVVGLSSGAVAGAAAHHAAHKSGAQAWLTKAIKAEKKVGSVRVSGNIVEGKVKVAMSLRVNGDGEGGGSFKQQGSTIRITRVGPLIYFNAPMKFWDAHSTPAQAHKYGGKWIEVSALDSRFASFDQFLNVGDLVTAVFQGHTTPLTLSKPTSLNGRRVVIVGNSVKVKGKTSSGKMYISDTGKPYVRKIVYRGPTGRGTILFSSYGKAVPISTPPEPINLS